MGEPRSSSVYSVGLGVCQPAVSRRRRRRRSDVVWRGSIPSAVKLRGASRLTSRPFLACGSLELRREVSLVGGRVLADPAQLNNKDLVLFILVDGAGVAGWRLFGAEERRLPVRRGSPPVSRSEGRRCGGAPAQRPGHHRSLRGPVEEGRSCNFLSFMGCSVRTVDAI